MTTPHKHAALIKAWADGAQIEVQYRDGSWVWTPDPSWHAEHYRIKPEPKPDKVRYGSLVLVTQNLAAIGDTLTEYDNLKFTFDGETGELKTTEILNKETE